MAPPRQTRASYVADAWPPPTLGRYDVLLPIGSGGMATVFLARARAIAGFERVVALKCCHPHLRLDEEFATMFLDEARLAARIHHPNVVATVDLGDAQGLYLVMEYVEGDSLMALLREAAHRDATVPPGMVLRALVDALAGLHAAHELRGNDDALLGLVHRDVSPQNILVGTDGVARITDFGIAKARQRATITRDAEVKGKASYMAPEQVLAGGLTRRTDVFAAGIVLWEALTGHRLFREDTDAATLHAVLHRPVPRASTLAASVTPALDTALARALARDPDERFATAAGFLEALETCGVPLASSRALGAYVETALQPQLRERRAWLRAVARGEVSAVGNHRARADDAVAEEDPTVSVRADRIAAAAPASVSDATPAPSSQRRRGLATLSLLGVSGLGALAVWTATRATTTHAAPAPVRTIAVVTPVAVSPAPVTGPPTLALVPTGQPLATAPHGTAVLPHVVAPRLGAHRTHARPTAPSHPASPGAFNPRAI